MIKDGLFYKLILDMKIKVKENLLQRAQTYNMLENILRVEIPTQTVQIEKNGKKKEVEENPLSRILFLSKW